MAKQKKTAPDAATSTDKVKLEVGNRYDIEIGRLIVNHTENTRDGGEKAHDDASIERNAKSIAQFGQLQPGIVTLNADGEPELLAGYGRYLAICKANKDNGTNLPFRAEVVEAKTPLARILLDHESNRAKAITPVDHWRMANLLRGLEKPWTNKKIATYLDFDPSYISHLTKLDEVTDDIRDRVKNGEISLKTVVDSLSKMRLPEQESVIEVAKAIGADQDEEFDGKLDNGLVNAALRKLNDKDDDTPAEGDAPSNAPEGASSEKGGDKEAKATTPKPTVAPALKLTEVKQFFKDNYGLPGENEVKKRFFAVMAELFAGKRQKPLVLRLDALLEGKPEPVIGKEKPAKKTPAAE